MHSPTGLRGAPPDRVRVVVDRPARPAGDFVLYWMIAQRRLGWNFALWGAYNGAGLAALAVWRHRRGPAPSGTPVRDALSTLATFHFFAFGLILFACDVPQARQVVARLLGIFA